MSPPGILKTHRKMFENFHLITLTAKVTNQILCFLKMLPNETAFASCDGLHLSEKIRTTNVGRKEDPLMRMPLNYSCLGSGELAVSAGKMQCLGYISNTHSHNENNESDYLCAFHASSSQLFTHPTCGRL